MPLDMLRSAYRRQAARLEPRIKVWVESSGNAVLGDFRVDLLRAIEETGSLSAAAQKLGLSYRRAWDKVRDMERNFGARLVLTEKGGTRRGGSRLTPRATTLLNQYERFRKRMEADLQKEFKRVFAR
jgi:molybdate transport system regulatory protein